MHNQAGSLVQLCFLAVVVLHQTASSQDAIVTKHSKDRNGMLHTISLQKQYVPVVKNSQVIAHKTAYFGKVFLGSGLDPFTVVFDSGSGHFILPSSTCLTETCAKHKRYNRTASRSAVDINHDGEELAAEASERDKVDIAFGTGEVQGEFIREIVCLSQDVDHCITFHVVLATEMTAEPFGLFAFDGVLGLGLSALALSQDLSFMSQLTRQHPTMLPQFSVFLARGEAETSSISFGGYDATLASTSLQWAPVALPELGYWQVQLAHVRIGDTVLEECEDGSCRAILDTGTSLLGVPRQMTRRMHSLLLRKVSDDQLEDTTNIDCRRVPGAMIHFDLGDSIISVAPEDYSRPAPFNMTATNSKLSTLCCRSLLLPIDAENSLGPKVFIWGEPVLKRYYTVYDWASKQVGFSIAASPLSHHQDKPFAEIGTTQLTL